MVPTFYSLCIWRNMSNTTKLQFMSWIMTNASFSHLLFLMWSLLHIGAHTLCADNLAPLKNIGDEYWSYFCYGRYYLTCFIHVVKSFLKTLKYSNIVTLFLPFFFVFLVLLTILISFPISYLVFSIM